MTTNEHQLEQLIREKRLRIAKLEREILELKAETRGLEAAASALGIALSEPATEPAAPRKARVRRRTLSTRWKKFLREMADHSQFTLGDAEDVVFNLGEELDPATVRSQMSQFAKRGFLDRLEDGVYTLTSKGREAAGLPPNKPSIPPDLDDDIPF